MNLRNLLPQRTAPETATPERLEDLLAQAEAYGMVTIFGLKMTSDSQRHYQVDIDFSTQSGISLKAESDFHLPLNAALRQAIDRAEKIRAQFK